MAENQQYPAQFLRDLLAIIEAPDGLYFLREFSKTQFWEMCIRHENGDLLMVQRCFDRMIEEAEREHKVPLEAPNA
jgi:hypothetical protein